MRLPAAVHELGPVALCRGPSRLGHVVSIRSGLSALRTRGATGQRDVLTTITRRRPCSAPLRRCTTTVDGQLLHRDRALVGGAGDMWRREDQRSECGRLPGWRSIKRTGTGVWGNTAGVTLAP